MIPRWLLAARISYSESEDETEDESDDEEEACSLEGSSEGTEGSGTSANLIFFPPVADFATVSSSAFAAEPMGDGPASSTCGGSPLKSLSTLFNWARALESCVSRAISSAPIPPEVTEPWFIAASLEDSVTLGTVSLSAMKVDRNCKISSLDKYDGSPTEWTTTGVLSVEFAGLLVPLSMVVWWVMRVRLRVQPLQHFPSHLISSHRIDHRASL